MSDVQVHYEPIDQIRMVQLAYDIERAEQATGILEFLDRVYGPQAHSIKVINDGDYYDGLAVEAVEVYDVAGHLILPDFTLPYWKDADLEALFYEADQEQGTNDQFIEKLRAVYSYLQVDQEEYHDVFDPEQTERRYVEDMRKIVWPEIYRKVKTHE